MSFKKVFFIVVGTVLFGITLIVVGGLMMPREVKVSRSIQITAPASFIFPYMNVPRNFTEWSPWGRYDSKIFYSYEGPRSGEGASLYWASDHEKVGSGSQTITSSAENREIRISLRFGDNRRAKAGFVLDEEGKTTRVRWEFSTDYKNNLTARYLGPFMDGLIGPEYEAGLARLKDLVEKEYEESLESAAQTSEETLLERQNQDPTKLITPLE